MENGYVQIPRGICNHTYNGASEYKFFILFANLKIEDRRLKVFVYVIAILLWIAAIVVFSTGIYISSKSKGILFKRMMKQTPHRMMSR